MLIFKKLIFLLQVFMFAFAISADAEMKGEKRTAQLMPFAFFKQNGSSCTGGGFSAGGGCWYAGALNQSCTTVCNNLTMVYDSITLSHAGSGGSDANCLAILTGLSLGSGAMSTNSNNRGCQYNTGTNRVRGTSSTSAGSSNASVQRACACLPQDVTPDVINFADFNDVSSIQTITGINTSINLQISATNSVGTPTLMYRQNSGTWTAFTTGSPANVSFSSGDTLQLLVSGTVTHAANFTITNTSDGSTVLDTALGTMTLVCTGGYAYGGTCYYLSTAADTCYSKCSTLNGCLWQETKAGAASSGICSTLLTALGVTPGGSAAGAYEYACAGNGSNFRSNPNVIKCGAAAPAGWQRVCACGTGGTFVAGEVALDGYNYRLGASGASCDTACSGHGSCDLAGLNNAYSSGTKCTEILSKLDYAPTSNSSTGDAAGCGYDSGVRHMGGSTTCAGTASGTERVCACTNP